MARTRKANRLYRNTDGRYYTAVEWSEKGFPRRIYLTRDERQSSRWLTVLDGVTDHDEATHRIATLKRADSPEDEQRLISEMLSPKVWIPVKSAQDATRQLRELVGDDADIDDQTVNDWLAAESAKDQRAILLHLGADEEWINDNPDIFVEIAASRRKRLNPDLLHETRRSRIKQAADHARDPIAKAVFNRKLGTIGSGPKLKDCLDVWEEWAGLDGLRPKHIAAYKRIFGDFIKETGNKAVNILQPGDFIAWEKYVLTEQKRRDLSAKWINDQYTPIRAVILKARDKKRGEKGWSFPTGLSEWMEFERKRHQPKPANKKPLPVDVYQSLLTLVDGWADIDVDQYADKKGISKRSAKSIQRKGIQWAAILRLGVNCGFANRDIEELTPDHLHLDGPLPYHDLPRSKPERQTGDAVIRMHPLLPSTVKSIQRWMKYETVTETVFRSERKYPLYSDKLSKQFEGIREEVKNGNGWSFKHCRNVGPTLNKRSMPKGMPDMRSEFLGHNERGTNKFYTDDVDQTYLIPVVNLIGGEYFDGEQVQK